MSSPLHNQGRIPQELVNAVLEELRGDILTLCACSLVCRPWTNPSQALIFAPIYLLREDGRNNFFSKDRPHPQSLLSFCNFLETFPHLAPLVGTFKLQSKGPALPGPSSSRAAKTRWNHYATRLHVFYLPSLT